ncbi:carbohydrate sulfotransferase 12-like [Limanda limanda]|uniref:carbohydrate sulfotransferase 12-like n=1 Tax=Limanda limanda TaxID=27771 RepID=UPI0029C971AD|nr:carbohydrate sulfotransferase 12-like [Limanda limanda]
MGSRRCLRVAIILGSLFMTLLLLVYWDDVRGFSLQPLLEPGSHQAASWPRKTGVRVRVRVSTSVREQEARKQRVKDVCSGQGAVEFPGRTRRFEQIPNGELKHLIVDDKHQVIYCFVPKVACTNWKKVMAVLSQSMISPSTGKPYTDPNDIPGRLVVHSHGFFTFSQFGHRYGSLSRHQMELKLQHYTKFLFVRDPFVRLISAFRDKFGSINQQFYDEYGSIMLRRYGNLSGAPPKTSKEAFAAGILTFLQFIKYLLDPETEPKVDDDHWQQVYRLCHPCQVGYDFIGRMETQESDAEHLLKLLKVDHLISFPSSTSNLTAASWETEWFAQIPIQMRRELYKMYEADFELFGYPKPDSILNP